MTMVKEIMGQSMAEAFSVASLHPKRHFQNPIQFSLSQPLSSSVKTKPELKTGLLRLAPLIPFVEESKRTLSMNPLTVRGTVTIKNSKDKVKELMALMLRHFDGFDNSVPGTGIVMQLVSTEVDPETFEPKVSKETILKWSKDFNVGAEKSIYKVEFEIDPSFGMPGAVTVINKYDKEFFLESISIEDVVRFSCDSWVQPAALHPEKRIFFTNKAHLPCLTPVGLKELRKKELGQLRGEGKGVRKPYDRVYDYDVYNDLGNPDKGNENARPILGGQKNPHPRRCRTGRPPCTTDMKAETPVKTFMETYMPRDEAFEDVRKETLDVERIKAVTRNLIPFFRTCVTKCGDFKQLSEISSIYSNPSVEKITTKQMSLPSDLINIQDSLQDYFKFNTPSIISGNGCCIQDKELGRQALAGVNPLSIKRLETFPPESHLDPFKDGPQESALKAEHIISHMDGMSVQRAMEEKKLFILDYHDAYIPFLKGINAYEDRKAYATRTIFFLTQVGTLKPIAIELSLPPRNDQNRPSKQVLTPPVDSTSYWLWQLGKAHVCSNDSGVHQLVHHWLRTHACMEPFIIAAHRQLSAMHPIFKLLKPHMKHTLQINALAREALINGGGIIESDFSTGKYSAEIVSAAYRDWWRFDLETLPADLIRRGLAEPDPTQPHGLKLHIEDYPYANDGLLIWFVLENLVRTYVNYYYRDGHIVRSDIELQAWYDEAVNVGHADHQHANWWPSLSTPSDLTSILTTLIWSASVQHSAVNFGQYPFGGYVPMRPPVMKRLLPNEEDPEEYKEFVKDPEGYVLSSLPNLFQTTKFLAVVNLLSQHSSDEEYIGQRKDLSDWAGDPEIVEAFYKFSIELKKIEKEIEKRNNDPKLKNRCGAGIPPYELLIASSSPGVTSRGVPNSISI